MHTHTLHFGLAVDQQQYASVSQREVGRQWIVRREIEAGDKLELPCRGQLLTCVAFVRSKDGSKLGAGVIELTLGARVFDLASGPLQWLAGGHFPMALDPDIQVASVTNSTPQSVTLTIVLGFADEPDESSSAASPEAAAAAAEIEVGEKKPRRKQAA